MGNLYLDLERKHREEKNKFPSFYAYDAQTLQDGMISIGLRYPEDIAQVVIEEDTQKYVKRSDLPALQGLLKRQAKERQEALLDLEFCRDMFKTKMISSAYYYYGSLSDVLDACDMQLQDVKKDPLLLEALCQAHATFFDYDLREKLGKKPVRKKLNQKHILEEASRFVRDTLEILDEVADHCIHEKWDQTKDEILLEKLDMRSERIYVLHSLEILSDEVYDNFEEKIFSARHAIYGHGLTEQPESVPSGMSR